MFYEVSFVIESTVIFRKIEMDKTVSLWLNSYKGVPLQDNGEKRICFQWNFSARKKGQTWCKYNRIQWSKRNCILLPYRQVGI